MAKIKSYTDISQSKKLAEILPIESADMKWYFWKDEIDAPKIPTFGYSKTAAESYKNTEAVYLACWSLAALIEVLPLIEGFKPVIDLDINQILYEGKYRDELNVNSENLIDACYEMIIRLHELKML